MPNSTSTFVQYTSTTFASCEGLYCASNIILRGSLFDLTYFWHTPQLLTTQMN